MDRVFGIFVKSPTRKVDFLVASRSHASLADMLEAWKDLLSSKKFWTAILAVVTLVAGKKGLAIDEPTFWAVAGVFISLIGAQGLTDHGKERPVAGGSVANEPAKPAAPPATPPLSVVPPPSDDPTPTPGAA